MSITVLVAIIAATASLVGAIIGSVTTLIAGSRQHRREVQRQEADRRREREVAAAEKCDALLYEIAELTGGDPLAPSSNPGRYSIRKMNGHLREFYITAAQLPREMADRAIEALEYINSAFAFGNTSENRASHHHYYSPYVIIGSVLSEIHDVFVAFVKGDKLPGRSDLFLELSAVSAEFLDMVNTSMSEADQEADAGRARFLASYPALKRELEARNRRSWHSG